MTPERLQAFELLIKARKQAENDSVKSHGKREIDSNDEDNGESCAQSNSVSFSTIGQPKNDSDYEDADAHVSTQDTENTINNPFWKTGRLKNYASYENTESHESNNMMENCSLVENVEEDNMMSPNTKKPEIITI